MRLVDMFEAVKGNAEEKLAGQICGLNLGKR